MAEPDDSPELQEQIDQAKAAGDSVLADSLYQRQLGSTDLALSLDPHASAVVEDQDEALPASQALTVITGNDDTYTLSGGMNFANRPERVEAALEVMRVWGDDEVAALQGKWGPDMGSNLAYFESFARAHPDVLDILVDTGLGDHPAIVEIGAILGERYATVSGDHVQESNMSEIDNDSFDEKTNALMTEQHQAQEEGNTGKVNRLEREIRALFVKRYGTEAAVGSSGGPTV